MQDVEASADRISVSAQYFTSVSANQAPGDGTRIFVRANSNKSSAVLYLNGHSANVEYQDGNRIDGAIVSGGVYEMIFSSVDVAWKIQNPDLGVTSAETAVAVTPTNFQHAPGLIPRTGAVDGSNSSTAIQAAIDQGEQATGAAIKIPHGRFVLNASLDVDGTLSIVGTGYFSELELASAAAYRLLIEHPSYTAINGLRLRDFRIDGNTGGVLDSGLIQLNNGIGFIVDGLWIENGTAVSGSSGVNGMAFSVGSLGNTGPRGVISNNYIRNMSKSNINWTTQADSAAIYGNFCVDSVGSNDIAPGIQVNGGYNARVFGNDVNSMVGRGIYVAVDSDNHESPKHAIVAANTVRNNGLGATEGDGIALSNADSSDVYARTIVIANQVYNNGDGLAGGGSGINLAGYRSALITSNWIYDNALHGIIVNDATVEGGEISIINNVIEANNTKGNASGACVYVDGTVDRLEIRGNRMVATQGLSRERYAIYIADTAVINNLTVKDNDVDGMVTQEYYFGAGGATLTKARIDVAGRKQTTTNAQTTVFAWLIPDNSAVQIEARALACMSDGSQRAGYHTEAVVYRDGGSATIQDGGSVETDYFAEESNANYDASISVTGNLVVYLLTGDTSQTVNWDWEIKMRTIGG
jgi:hypothetical protein